MTGALTAAARYALLYCSPPQRAALRTLLAVRAEINSSLRAGLDHQVAHTRLAWWQEECMRASNGTAVHPLMRELGAHIHAHSGHWPNLGGWIRAAALKLAHAPLTTDAARNEYGGADGGTLLVALAQLLGAPASVHDAVRRIGASLGLIELLAEQAERSELRVEHSRLSASLTALPATAQPQLRSLLVWVAVAVDEAEARLRTPPVTAPLSLWSAFAQNVLAWRSARAADRQAFHIRPLPGTES